MTDTEMETIAEENAKTACQCLMECMRALEELEVANCDGFPEDVRNSVLKEFDPDIYDEFLWLTSSDDEYTYQVCRDDEYQAAFEAADTLKHEPAGAQRLRSLFDRLESEASFWALLIGQATTDPETDHDSLFDYRDRALDVVKNAATGSKVFEDYENTDTGDS